MSCDIDKKTIVEKEKVVKKVKTIIEKLGKDFSLAKTADVAFRFTIFKGLAWNAPSYITNFAEGYIANMRIAATGNYFTPENIYKAYGILKGSVWKNITLGLHIPDKAKIASTLINRYGIIQNPINELQKASVKSAYLTAGKKLGPMEGMLRTEFINQGAIALSIFLDEKVTSKDGKRVVNLLDAFDPNTGLLYDEFATEKNRNNWEKNNGKEYKAMKSKLTKTIISGHGDYHALRGNLASSYITGKAALMFKRWFPNSLLMAWGVEQPDIEVGMKKFKGRNRSHTQSSAAIRGALMGFMGLGFIAAGGLPGAVVGGTLGLMLGGFFGIKTNLTFLQEASFTIKETFLNMIRMPVNTLTGRATIKESNYKKFRGANVDDIDIRNMKAILIDTSILMMWTILSLIAKSLTWDDDDERDSKRRKMHNFLINRFSQLSEQSTMYENPIEMFKMGTEFAIFRFATDLNQLAIETVDFIEGDDVILTGPNAGQSALLRQARKTFAPGIFREEFGFGTSMSRQFKPLPYDSWFYGKEKIAKLEIQKMRVLAKSKYLGDNLREKQRKKIEKQIRAHFKKEESYVETLKRVKRKRLIINR